LSIEGDQLKIDSDVLGTIRLPLKALAGIIFRTPTDLRQADLLADQMIAAMGDTDRMLMSNGDELKGQLNGFAKKSIEFNAGQGPLKLDVARVHAVIFNP